LILLLASAILELEQGNLPSSFVAAILAARGWPSGRSEIASISRTCANIDAFMEMK
jgi:hypothetical protein